MSQNTKLNLWQKIKRLLTTAAPEAIVDTVPKRDSSSQTNNADITNDNPDSNNPEAHAQTSLIKETANVISIVDYLKHYLHNKQWHYIYYRPKVNDPQQSHHLSVRVRSKNLDCAYLFRVQEGNHLLAVYGVLPFLVPESHRSAAVLLLTQINYDMLIGNLEIDVNDGEIRYKNAIDLEVVGMSADIIEHLLQSVIAMTTVLYEVFSDLINTKDPSEDMSTLLIELRQQADARTFFLPTRFVQ